MKICPRLNNEGPIESPVSQGVIQLYLNNIWMMSFGHNIPCAVIPFTLKAAVDILMFKKRLKIEKMSTRHVNKRLLSGALSTRRLKRSLRLACLSRLL
jgi:hypothetical protein